MAAESVALVSNTRSRAALRQSRAVARPVQTTSAGGCAVVIRREERIGRGVGALAQTAPARRAEVRLVRRAAAPHAGQFKRPAHDRRARSAASLRSCGS
jgi:hypothetical protein